MLYAVQLRSQKFWIHFCLPSCSASFVDVYFEKNSAVNYFLWIRYCQRCLKVRCCREINRVWLSNELYYLEETIARRQHDLCEIEEDLKNHKTDLLAVQIEVLFLILFALFVI